MDYPQYELALNNRRTVAEIMAEVNEIIPNAFEDAVKYRWLSECETKIITEVFLAKTFSDLYLYKPHESDNRRVLVGQPYDSLYDEWMRYKIEWGNGEYDKANNTAILFNQKLGEFTEWFCNYYQTWKWEEPWRQFVIRT